MKKRLLSLALVLVMLLGVLPTAALAAENADDNGVVFTKELVEGTADQPAKIKLEAYTTGEVTTGMTKIPADIVLVLDQSGSMDENMSGRTRLEVMRTAVENFVNKVASMDAGSGLYRIAIVGFASESGYGNNTELLTATRPVVTYEYQTVSRDELDITKTYYIESRWSGYTEIEWNSRRNDWYTTGWDAERVDANETIYEQVEVPGTPVPGVPYGDLTDAHYAGALVDCNDPLLGEAIAALDCEGATRTDLGMEMAQKIFAAQNVDYSNRSKIVVLITDGVPTTQSNFSDTVANAAVSYAATMKAGGAKIFSMYMGTPSNQSANFLQACSSNYPAAESIYNLGTKAADSYYSAYTDASAIEAMFSGIASSITSNSTLNEQSVVQDILSADFKLAASIGTTGARQIEVYTVEKTASGWSDVEVPFSNASVTVGGYDNKTISVTGFNFGAHCITDAPKDGQYGTDYGRKLVIYIPIVEDPSSDSFGGWLKTNAGAYIYHKGSLVETATPAYDSATIRYSLTAAERAFHVDGTQLSNPVEYTFDIPAIAADVLTEMITKLPNGTNNAGVNMEYKLYDIGSAGSTNDDVLVASLSVGAGVPVDATNPDNWTLKDAGNPTVIIPANEYFAEKVYVLACTLTSTEPVAQPDSLTVYAYLDLSVVRGDLAHIVYGEIDEGGKLTVSSGAPGSLVGNTYTEAVTQGEDSATMTFVPNPGYQISKITYFSSVDAPFDTPTVIYPANGIENSVELADDGSWSFQATNVQSGVAVEVETRRITHTLTTSHDDGSEIIAGMTYAHEDANMNVPFHALPGYQLTELTVNGQVYNLKTDTVPANVAVLTVEDGVVVGGHAIVSKTQSNTVIIESASRSYNVTLVYMVEDILGTNGYPERYEVEGPTPVEYGTLIADGEAPKYNRGDVKVIDGHNYTLSDWYTVKNEVVDFGTAKMPAEDLTVYAMWTRNPDVKIAEINIAKEVVGDPEKETTFNFVAVFHEQVEGTAEITISAASETVATAEMEIVMTDRQAELFKSGNGYVYIYELIPDETDGWLYDETVYELRWDNGAVLYLDGQPLDALTAAFTNERVRSEVKMKKVVEVRKAGATETTAIEGPVQPGDVLYYTVYVKSNGNVALTDVKITDTMVGADIKNIDFTNTTNVTFNKNTGVFTVKELPLGLIEKIEYSYTVTEADAGKTISNSVTVNVPEDNDDDNTTETTVEKKSVALTKQANKAEAKVGETITYTVTVKNTGNVALTNVVLTDSLKGIAFNGNDNPGVTYDAAAGKFTVAALAVGETKTFTYTYVVTQADVGKTVSNVVTAEDYDTPPAEENVIVPKHQITGFTKEVVRTEEVSGLTGITYPAEGETLIVPENGVTLLYKFTVTGDVGAKFEIVDENAVAVSGDLNGIIPEGGTAVVYATKTYSASDIANDVLKNVATLKPGDNTEPGDKTDEEEVPAEPAAATVVKYPIAAASVDGVNAEYTPVTKNGETYELTVPEGAESVTLLYAVEVTANGQLSREIMLEDAGAVYVGSTTSADYTVTRISDTTVKVEFSKNAVAAVYFTRTFDLTDGEQTLSNSVKVNNGDPIPGDDVEVETAEIGIEKTVSATEPAKAGDVLTYTVTLTNDTDVDAVNVVFADTLTAIDAQGNTEIRKTETFTVAVVPAGESVDVTYTYTVTKADAGCTLKNVAVVKDGGEDDVEVDVDPLKLYGVDKAVVTEKPETWPTGMTEPADVTYPGAEKKVTFTGSAVKLLYTLTVTGEPGAKYTLTDDGAEVVFGELTGIVPESGSVTVYVTKTFYISDIENGKLSNTVAVNGGDNSKDPDDPDDTEEVEADVKTGLTVLKKAWQVDGKDIKSYRVKAGQKITWAIVVRNTGAGDLTNVNVVDSLTVGKKVGNLTIVNADGTAVLPFALAAGEEVILYAEYTAVAADAGKVLSNYVVVTGEDHDNDPDNDPKAEDKNEEISVQSPDLPGPALNKADHVAYIIGYEDDTVRPENNITRAEVATIFFRLLTDESRAYYWSQTNNFSDVDMDDWFNNAISTMANAGIVNGYPDGGFHPNEPITRAEFAAVAARFSDVIYNGESGFSDVLKTHWAFDEIALAEHLGWINGYPDNTFRPDKYITRAEAMTLINRVLERAVEEEHMLSTMITWVDNKPSEWYYEAVQEATNSHIYVRTKKLVPGQGFYYEDWIQILTPPDWAALEKAWSKANDH